jgi:hypothetical protein
MATGRFLQHSSETAKGAKAKLRGLSTFVGCLILAHGALAQQSGLNSQSLQSVNPSSAVSGQLIAFNNDMPGSPNASSASAATTVVRPAGSAPAIPAWETDFDRWVDLNAFNYGSRYRSTFDANGARSFDQGQERLIADGKFKFDEQGRYGIGFHLSSGRYFNWAYSDFIGGGQLEFVHNTEAKMNPYQRYVMNALPPAAGFYNSGGAQLYFRQMFLTAAPIHGVEVQFGGLGINRGVNTEATSYDEDGYISGERLTIKRPKQLWLSELSYTRAYLGDFYTPNFFARGQRLSISNYWQILGRKDFGNRFAVSADYTNSRPENSFSRPFLIKTTREGILVDVHESKALDKVRFEAYQRLNSGDYAPGTPFPSGKGYAMTVSRSFKTVFAFEAGISDIDTGYITTMGLNLQAIELGLTVNGDQYGIGRRYFVRPTIPLTKYLSLAGNYNHLFATNRIADGNPIDIWNAQYLTAGFVIDAKKLFFHAPAVQ